MKKFVLWLLPLFFVLAACGVPTSEMQTPQTPQTPPVSETAPGLVPLPGEELLPAQAYCLSVRADRLNVRTGAGVGFAKLGQAERDSFLRYDGLEGGWYRTVFRGTCAYVSAEYAELRALPAADERTERVVLEGLRLLGTPYVYGATRFHDGTGTRLKGFSEDAFDCSSLMQYIFFRGAGVLLNVTTRTQVVQGTHVEKDELRRGDLLFFTNDARRNKTGIERVGHVALYLGEGYILHTASDYARAEPLSEKRLSYFLEARRVL